MAGSNRKWDRRKPIRTRETAPEDVKVAIAVDISVEETPVLSCSYTTSCLSRLVEALG
jgi:hypothetical protein